MLYVVKVLVTRVTRLELVSVVLLESYLNVVFNISFVVSGSTTTGVMPATLYVARPVTISFFSCFVSICPVVDLIEIKTLPYSLVSTTPRLVS